LKIIKHINSEPYVRIKTSKKHKSISFNQKFRQEIKANFYALCFDYLDDQEINGDYFEFGVHKFRTFYMAYKFSEIKGLNSMSFRLFDSFQGLPFTENIKSSKLSEGNLVSTKKDLLEFINKNKFDEKKIKIFEGFYSNIPSSLDYKELINYRQSIKAAMVCIDCNLYDSYVQALDLVLPFLQTGTIVYLDDYYSSPQSNKNPRKAFEELQSRLEIEFIPFLNVGWWGKSFIVNQIL
jgi:O-methyltransferase